MRRVHLIMAILFGLLTGAPGVNAKTTGVNTLTGVTFESDADALTFTFQGMAPMTADSISASSEGDVLNLRLEQTRAGRRWVTLADPSIARALLHPSKRAGPATVLRIRMTDVVSDEVLRNVIVRAEGKRLIAAVPRNTEVAARWAAPDAEIEAEVAEEATPPATATETAIPNGAPEAEPPVAEDAETPAAPVAAASGPAEHSEDTPLKLPTERAPQEAVVAGLGTNESSGPSLGAVAMSTLFLMAMGFVMWRKMRPAAASAAGGRAIRPVGSHMLGPKHHLLLVDVAGQLVLLGSGDKGVQMLTTIQPSADITPADVPVPLDAMPTAAQAAPSFSDRLGLAVARIRDTARGMKRTEVTDEITSDEVEREFFRREKEAVAEAAEQDAIDALASEVTDRPDIGRARMRRAAAPKPAAKATTRTGGDARADLENDLLRKIRRLQSA